MAEPLPSMHKVLRQVLSTAKREMEKRHILCKNTGRVHIAERLLSAPEVADLEGEWRHVFASDL